jgi:hypothetical protein
MEIFAAYDWKPFQSCYIQISYFDRILLSVNFCWVHITKIDFKCELLLWEMSRFFVELLFLIEFILYIAKIDFFLYYYFYVKHTRTPNLPPCSITSHILTEFGRCFLCRVHILTIYITVFVTRGRHFGAQDKSRFDHIFFEA